MEPVGGGKGVVFGVGLGPGDPELVTLKAARLLKDAKTVAYFRKRGQRGRAFAIAERHLDPQAELLVLEYPYTTEIAAEHTDYVVALESFYDESAARIAARLDARRDVVVLCEGDPLFYGSYMYLHDRLMRRYRCTVVPGITSFAGCAASAALPLVSTDKMFAVIPGTLPEAELEARIRAVDACAILKLGKNYPKVRRVLDRLERTPSAYYFEHGTTTHEVAMKLSDKCDDKSVYFALIIVPNHDGRPERRSPKAPHTS
jgi:precorrin-2/cobalt-factor-2 C20-methyltransferase